ncbi:MAG: hypothetical protein V2I33_13225 [Kangiellaceae bacterium]|jgi:Tol biopolymer transport system component|nr:hypothetical protein [Kangiellaceae bacterium]
MTRILTLTILFLSINSLLAQQFNPEPWPKLNGPYLGQPLPGDKPELFAPGLISKSDQFELNSVFSPKQKIFMFSRVIDGTYKMFFSSQNKQGVWSEPRLAGPSKTYPGHRDVDMTFSPDGKWLYFISDRPLKGYSLDRYNVWRSRIGEFGLERPEALAANINGPAHELYPMIVADGSLYFTAPREGGLGGYDSYRAQYKTDGTFEDPVNLGGSINTKTNEGDIYVSPDESYMVHVSSDRDDGFGRGDLYISFKQSDGSWSKDKNMGPDFNTKGMDYCPVVTPDGKYFFFSRDGDVFWVDAKMLQSYN